MCSLAILAQDFSNFGDPCLEFWFWKGFKKARKMANLVEKTPAQGIFDIEFSLSKGIIFVKIGQANCII